MMSASRNVPAACIARSAAISTTSPPLPSPTPGAGGAVAVAGEGLERAVGLEHRVEMADQEDALAAPVAAVDGDDMAGAAGGVHVDPAHLEAQRRELGADHLADRVTPARFSVPLFWFTRRSSRAIVRSSSPSTVAAIACSSGLAAGLGGDGKGGSGDQPESGCHGRHV